MPKPAIEGEKVSKDRFGAWWEKNFPPEIPHARIVRVLAEKGPSSPYDISRALYKTPPDGYATVFRNLKQLEEDEMVKKIRVESSAKGRKRHIYSLTEYSGILAAWAYLGEDLDFDKLLKTHADVFKDSDAVALYRLIWKESDPKFCVRLARKAFMTIIEGIRDSEQLFGILFGFIMESKELSKRKRRNIAAGSKIFQEMILDIHDEMMELYDEIEERRDKK